MIFYHCTTSRNGARLRFLSKKPKKIRKSEFNYKACLIDWLNFLRPGTDYLEGSTPFMFPREYYDGGINKKVFWLGNGFYCFSEEYIDESPQYSFKHGLDVIFEVDYEDEFEHFDMYEAREDLSYFLQNVVMSHYEKLDISDEKKEAMGILIELLLIEIEDYFFSNPHSAAIVLEMFLDIRNLIFDVISNKFLRDEEEMIFDNFSAIRNLNLIKGLQPNYDLSREIRVLESN